MRFIDHTTRRDALQYPLLLCRGEDGYSINLPQYDSSTKFLLEKTIFAASFCSYRIMLRERKDINHLLHFCSLFIQFLVGLYAEIKTERLRADSYIH